MPIIELTTQIYAPVSSCFDLSRSIDLHIQSMKHTSEQAVGGVTRGLINLREDVTWKARHFGILFSMTTKITAFEYPLYFVDEMIKGPFKKLHHTHLFEEQNGYTIMRDKFEFSSPLGVLGYAVDYLFLKRYLIRLLERRNKEIKAVAEVRLNMLDDDWR